MTRLISRLRWRYFRGRVQKRTSFLLLERQLVPVDSHAVTESHPKVGLLLKGHALPSLLDVGEGRVGDGVSGGGSGREGGRAAHQALAQQVRRRSAQHYGGFGGRFGGRLGESIGRLLESKFARRRVEGGCEEVRRDEVYCWASQAGANSSNRMMNPCQLPGRCSATRMALLHWCISRDLSHPPCRFGPKG